MAPKHVFQSLTINASLLGLLASGASMAVSPNFWGKAANCAEEFNAPGLATGLREIIPVVTGMSALGAIAGRLKAGNVAFWTPQGVPGPNREDFVRGEVNVPIELTEIRSQTELSNKAVGHLAEVVQGLQSRMEQVPVVEDIKGTIEMGEREPDQIIDIAREKLMELI